jgi:hypothetical protein
MRFLSPLSCLLSFLLFLAIGLSMAQAAAPARKAPLLSGNASKSNLPHNNQTLVLSGFAKKATTNILSPGTNPLAPKLESAKFYHCIDMPARYLKLKNDWQNAHRANVPEVYQLADFAQQAYDASTHEEPLARWQLSGGPNPWIFRPKVHLVGVGTDATLDVQFRITVQVRMGPLRVHPKVLMSDLNYLIGASRVKTLYSQVIGIPAIAPGEEMLLPGKPIALLPLIAQAPNQWPVEAIVTAAMVSPAGGPVVRSTLPILPDHFVLPMAYY